MQDIVKAAMFVTSAVGLAFPCLSWISANGRYAYDAEAKSALTFPDGNVP